MFGSSNPRAQSSTATRRSVSRTLQPTPVAFERTRIVLIHHRLMKEYRDLTSDPLQGTITAGPVDEDNMLEWEALIQGPEGTPYVSTLTLATMLHMRGMSS